MYIHRANIFDFDCFVVTIKTEGRLYRGIGDQFSAPIETHVEEKYNARLGKVGLFLKDNFRHKNDA